MPERGPKASTFIERPRVRSTDHGDALTVAALADGRFRSRSRHFGSDARGRLTFESYVTDESITDRAVVKQSMTRSAKRRRTR